MIIYLEKKFHKNGYITPMKIGLENTFITNENFEIKIGEQGILCLQETNNVNH